MKSYQCLVIGISRYQFLEPLSHAETDTKTIYQFFSEEMKIPKQQVLLMNDTSPTFESLSTYPNQDNILDWLKIINQETHSTWVNPLWIFFNGHGLNYQGEDYLMPIDGNPQDIPNTGISIRSLVKTLQQQTRPILLFLNLYYSGTTTPLGQQTVSLAKQKEIGLILSLSSANEIQVKSQGTFTTALLEALHYYRSEITLAKLAHYLIARLPPLNLPSQNILSTPIIISPSHGFSSQSLFAFTQRQTIGAIPSYTKPIKQPVSGSNTVLEEKTIPHLPLLPTVSVAAAVINNQQQESVKTSSQNNKPKHSVRYAVALPPRVSAPSSATLSNKHNYRKKWFWVGGVCGFFFLSFLVFVVRLILSVPSSDSPETFLKFSDKELPANDARLLNQAISYLKDNQASGFNRAINEVRNIPSNSPVYRQAQEKVSLWSQIILDIAQGRAKEENFKDAIEAARLVPAAHPRVYNLAVEAIKIWEVKAKQQQVNQALIDGAKALIKPSSASSYLQGITILKQIRPDEPNFKKAQQLVEQWSQKIYLLANSRATQGKYQQAIATAQLVPSGTSAYKMAGEAIVKWKKQRNLSPSD